MKSQHVGFGTSLVIHTLFVSLFLIMGTTLKTYSPPISIDFSIVSGRKAAAVQPKTNTDRITEEVSKKYVVPKPKIVKKVALHKPKVKTIAKPVSQVPLIPEPVFAKNDDIVEEVEEISEPEVVEQTKMASNEVQADDKVTYGYSSSGAEPYQSPEVQYFKQHFKYIQDEIRKQMVYPVIARKRGWQGRVVLSFKVCMDGRVEDVKIVESSGYAVLDNNAVKTVLNAAPFPVPPVRAELIIPVVYGLV